LADYALISAIVLAAGRSTRMGKNKLVLPLDGKPVLQRVLDALKDSKVDETVVVLGGGAEEVRRSINLEGTKVVVNRRYAEGMSTSIKAGLSRVNRFADAAIIVLGDQPFLSAAVVDALVKAFLAEGAPVVLPVHLRKRGNPVLFARSVFPEIMRIDGDRGAKSVVEAHGDDTLEVEVEDEGVAVDVDTPLDYARATLLSRRVKRRRNRGPA
jgi:molybdenum cofactor cytidylyltransferase